MAVTVADEGVLRIHGGDTREVVWLVENTRGAADSFDDRVQVSIAHGGGVENYSVALWDVWAVYFRGYGGRGADTFVVRTNVNWLVYRCHPKELYTDFSLAEGDREQRITLW